MATTPLCASVLSVDVSVFSPHRHMYGMGEGGTRVGTYMLIVLTGCITHKWAKCACASSGERHGMYMCGALS